MVEDEEKKLLDVKIGNLKEVTQYSYDLTLSKKALREDFEMEMQGKKTRKSFKERLKERKVFRFYWTPRGLVIEITSAEEEAEKLGQN